MDEVIEKSPAYEIQIWIEDDTLSLLAEGVQKLQHEFSAAIDGGRLGIASTNAGSRFDQIAGMQLEGGTADTGIDELPQDEALRDIFYAAAVTHRPRRDCYFGTGLRRFARIIRPANVKKIPITSGIVTGSANRSTAAIAAIAT